MQLPTVSTEATIPVNEIFGPTIQGEGPDIGRPVLFLRTHRCPVHCPGCDTHYTWDGTEKGQQMTVAQIQAKLQELKADAPGVGLIVSGGEPLLHYRNGDLRGMIKRWTWAGLETSGYIGNRQINEPDFEDFLESFTTVCLSPKITPCLHGEQTDAELESLFPFFKNVLNNRLVQKYVVKDQADIDAILLHLLRVGEPGRVYLMPYGNERDEILRVVDWLVPVAAKHGFSITPRLHALLWGATRKV